MPIAVACFGTKVKLAFINDSLQMVPSERNLDFSMARSADVFVQSVVVNALRIPSSTRKDAAWCKIELITFLPR